MKYLKNKNKATLLVFFNAILTNLNIKTIYIFVFILTTTINIYRQFEIIL